MGLRFGSRLILGVAAFVTASASLTASAQDWGQILQGALNENNNSGGWNNNNNNGWGGNNNNNGWGGNNNNNGWGQNNNQGQYRGNWLEQRAVMDPRTERMRYETQPNIGNIINDVGQMLNEGQQQQNDQPNYRPQYRPQNRPQNYVPQQYRPQQVVQPRRVVSPPKKDVAVKKNPTPKPKEKIVALRYNSPAGDVIDPFDPTALALTENVVAEKAQESVDELEQKLGDAGQDPAVQAKLDELRKKIDNGEKVTQQDIDELKGLVDPAKLPPQATPADADQFATDLDKLTEDVVGLSEANEVLNQQPPPGVGPPMIPQGPTNVIMVPELPADQMGMLPSGDVLMGTGGQGEIDVAVVDASELVDVPIGVGEPVEESAADLAKRVKSGVYLMNPEINELTVNYVVTVQGSESAGTNYSMKAGQTQTLADGKTWVVRFDRGQGKGQAKYTLSSGTYAFGSSDQGWELYKKTFSFTLDNSENEDPFYYNVNNTQKEVAAHDTETHTSKYPILVRFERGDESEGQKRIAEQNQVLKVAVNPEDGLWDLYPPENFSQLARAEIQEEPRVTKPSASTRTAKGKVNKKAAELRSRLLSEG